VLAKPQRQALQHATLSTFNYLTPQKQQKKAAKCKYFEYYEYLGIALATAFDRYSQPQTSCSFVEPDVMDNSGAVAGAVGVALCVLRLWGLGFLAFCSGTDFA